MALNNDPTRPAHMAQISSRANRRMLREARLRLNQMKLWFEAYRIAHSPLPPPTKRIIKAPKKKSQFNWDIFMV